LNDPKIDGDSIVEMVFYILLEGLALCSQVVNLIKYPLMPG
jgi:hypothetical protein